MLREAHRLLAQTQADERAGVTDPERLRRLTVLDLAAWIVVGIIGWNLIFHIPQGSVVYATVAIALVYPPTTWLLLRRRRQARAYQRGWLDGRRQLFASIDEALNREMTLAEWVRTELERDTEVIKRL